MTKAKKSQIRNKIASAAMTEEAVGKHAREQPANVLDQPSLQDHGKSQSPQTGRLACRFPQGLSADSTRFENRFHKV
jgi:hypothetical protein